MMDNSWKVRNIRIQGDRNELTSFRRKFSNFLWLMFYNTPLHMWKLPIVERLNESFETNKE